MDNSPLCGSGLKKLTHENGMGVSLFFSGSHDDYVAIRMKVVSKKVGLSV
jgi:hypothetical protein